MAFSDNNYTTAGAYLDGNSVSPIVASDFTGFSQGDFTLQFRVTDTDVANSFFGGYTPYTSYLSSTNSDEGFTFGYNEASNNYELHMLNGTIFTFDASTVNVDAMQSNHIALSYDDTAQMMQLIVDGTTLGTTSLENPIGFSGDGHLLFGQSIAEFSGTNTGIAAFDAAPGAIILENITVFDSVRNETQAALDAKFGESINADMESMIHHWDMTQGSDNAAIDNISQMLLSLDTTSITEGDTAITPANAGVSLNTSSDTNADMIMIQEFDGFSNSPFTLEVGFSSSTPLTDESFISLVSYAEVDTDNALLIGMRDGQSFQIFAEDIGYVEFPYDLNDLMDGGQHTISVAVDPAGQNISLFVDGRDLGSRSFDGELTIEGGGTLVFGQEQDYMGGGFDVEQAFEGVISEGRVYNEIREVDAITQDALTGTSDLEAASLTSAWDFDQPVNGTVSDLVGDADAAAMTEALGTAQAQLSLTDFNRGLILNNNDESGQSASHENFNGFTADSFTFEMSFASVMNIGDGFNALMSYAENGFDNAFTLGTNHGGTVLQVHARSIGVVDFDINAWSLMDGNEHSIALTVDNDTLEMSMYIDGLLIDTQPMSEAMTVNGGGTLVFGQEQDIVGGGFDADQEFSGVIFDAALFSDIRTEAEIASDNENGLTGTEDNLHSKWEFSDASVTESISGTELNTELNPIHAVSINSLAGGVPINLEQSDQSLEIENFDGFLGAETTIELAFSSSMDLSGSFKPLMSYSEPGHDNALTFGFAHNGTALQLHMKGQDPISFAVDANGLMDGNTHEIALTMNEATGEAMLYVDGSLAGTLNFEALNLNGDGILVFGQEQDSFGGGYSEDQIFQGMIHEVRVFDEERSPEDVLADAQNGVDSVSEANLVSHWDMKLRSNLEIDDLVGNQNLIATNYEPPEDALPVFGDIDFSDMTEGLDAGAIVATVHASDSNWDEITFQLNDDHNGLFTIDTATGVVSISEGHSLSGVERTNYQIEVEALQNGSAVGVTQTVGLNIGDTATTENGTPAEAPIDYEIPVMETGILQLDQDIQQITLEQEFENPVVFAFVQTSNGTDPVVARVHNVVGNRFDIQLQEPDYLDNVHGIETVNYMVVEAGVWMMPDGSIFEAGTIESNKLSTDGFETVEFSAAFDDQPVILSHAQTKNDDAFIAVRQNDASEDGFSMTMQEQESTNSTDHGSETLGWIAIERGSGEGADFGWVTGSIEGVTNSNSNIYLSGDLEGDVSLVASMSTYNGGDSSWARGDGENDSVFSVSVQEESSKDTEINHTIETIDYFAFNTTGVINGALYEDPNAAPAPQEGNGYTPIDNNNNSYDETIFGSEGADLIYGGYGMDLIDGNSGNDTLVGNEGSDTFIINGEAGENGTDIYGGNTDGSENIPIAKTTAIMETGTLELSQDVQQVTLSQTFENPVVLAFVQTSNSTHAVATRISNVEGNIFDIKLQEPDYLDGTHEIETVNFMVVEEGIWVMPDGSIMEAGTVNTNLISTQAFKSVDFDAGFDEQPIILTSAQTSNDDSFIAVRQANATEDGFEITMQEQESTNSGSHAVETLGWVAIEPGSGSGDAFSWFAGRTSDTVTHENSQIDLSSEFDTDISVVASVSSYDGGDTSWARGDGLEDNILNISVEEESSRDSEVNHTTETIDYFAFNGTGVIYGDPYDPTLSAAEAGESQLWTDKVELNMSTDTDLLYTVENVDQENGFIELSNGEATISIQAQSSELNYLMNEDNSVASITLEANTDALLTVDTDSDGIVDTTYNLYDIETISIS